MKPSIDGLDFEQTSYRVNGVEWVVLRAGEGRPMMCMHGFPDTPESFRFQVRPLLDAGYELLIPYLPGYGPSTVTRSKYYYPGHFGGDLVALLDAMAIDRLIYLGHDWGAYAGYLLAATAPERVVALITAAMPHFSGFRHASLKQAARSHYIFKFQLPYLAEQWLERDDFATVDRLYRDWSPGLENPAEAASAIKALLRPPGKSSMAIGYYRESVRKGLFDKKQRDLLNQVIRVPTLIIAGENDGCIGAECFEQMDESFAAGFELQKIRNAGHFMHLEQFEAFNRLLLDYLCRQDPASQVWSNP